MSQTLRADRKHAIVLGGSMAGLLATRVLSEHFGRVSLIERDALPLLAEQRRGVPQGRHTHGLLASGRDVLEQLFPGISQALMKAGAVSGDIVPDSRWFFEGACLSRPPSGLNGLLMTRPLLEAAVRERVLANPKVVRRDELAVEELVVDAKSGRVTGVRARGQALTVMRQPLMYLTTSFISAGIRAPFQEIMFPVSTLPLTVFPLASVP